jgi:hypothetical protein
MNEDRDELKQLLQNALPPVGAQVLGRDLWGRVRSGLHPPARRVTWTDWIMVALVAGGCLVLPEILPTLLYLF